MQPQHQLVTMRMRMRMMILSVAPTIMPRHCAVIACVRAAMDGLRLVQSAKNSRPPATPDFNDARTLCVCKSECVCVCVCVACLCVACLTSRRRYTYFTLMLYSSERKSRVFKRFPKAGPEQQAALKSVDKFRGRLGVFAPVITVMQISQMVVGVVITCQIIANTSSFFGDQKCYLRITSVLLGLAMYFSYFCIFVDFAVKKYCCSKQGDGKAKAKGNNNNNNNNTTTTTNKTDKLTSEADWEKKKKEN